VAIARAIVSDPTLLVCDEPTGDLDRQSAVEVLTLLQQLNCNHDKTMIMVTHDPKAAEYARHTLMDIGALDAFRARLANDPRLKVEVHTTRDYFGRQSAAFTRIIRILGTTVGAIMAFGALFGVLNTMYSAVAARAREIATLRAIGFRRVPMIVSILLETMLLARGAPSVPRPRGQSSTASSPQPSARIPARWCSPSESRRLWSGTASSGHLRSLSSAGYSPRSEQHACRFPEACASSNDPDGNVVRAEAEAEKGVQAFLATAFLDLSGHHNLLC